MDKNITKIAHVVGLKGIGGVQRQFTEYLKCAKKDQELECEVYTVGKVDEQYNIEVKVYSLKKLRNILRLVFRVLDKNSIVHFYNKFGSIAVCIFLYLLPGNKIIVHERGAAWNISTVKSKRVRLIAQKASVILANSDASKCMLTEKFHINQDKITVIRNGLLLKDFSASKDIQAESIFKVGFIGRLEAFKGIHTLIDAVKIIKNKSIRFIIAGDGPLLEPLKQIIKNSDLNNVRFVGRVEDPYDFISGLNLLVVPSIREPLGNVCIEAGICGVPVIASAVDGIPEIVENKVSGELILQTKEPTISRFSDYITYFPDVVVEPYNCKLRKPMEIDPADLAKRIEYLSQHPEVCRRYSAAMSEHITAFSIEEYTRKLHSIYKALL